MLLTALVITILSVLAGLALGAVGVLVALRRWRQSQASLHAAAVESAVQQVLAERGATASAVTADRERVVEAVVEQAVSMAATSLDARLQTGSRELDLRSRSFEDQVKSIDQRLEQVTRLVTDLQRDKASQHGQVVTELRAAAARNKELHETTSQLREVLASPRARGQWGERMAEDVLRAAGFREGINYRKQSAQAGGTIPDFTFLLPRDLELNMDVKFPIDNYVRFVEATDDPTRDQARRQFARDVRQRVREIADRAYIDPERTVDLVVLFIPNESIYSFLHENDAALIDQALGQKVVLCSPVTLFSVLAIIRQSVDNFRLERRSDEILQYLGAFRSEWVKFSDQIDKVGKHLDTLHTSFDALQGTRRNVMERTLRKVDELQRTDPVEVGELPAAASGGGTEVVPAPALGPSLRALRASS